MTTPSTTCPNCEILREAFDFLLEMTSVDPEDTDELDDPMKIAVKVGNKILRMQRMLNECLSYLRSLHDYCGDYECNKPHCMLANKISNNLAGEEE